MYIEYWTLNKYYYYYYYYFSRLGVVKMIRRLVECKQVRRSFLKKTIAMIRHTPSDIIIVDGPPVLTDCAYVRSNKSTF